MFIVQKITAFTRFILCIIVPINIIILVDYSEKSQNFRITIYNKEISNDISCHNLTTNDALRVVDHETFPEKSIFFHETSCKGGINSRESCAIESAARNNPDWQVNVLFSGPVNKKMLENGNLAVLKKLNNVKIARIYVPEYAKGTPAEQFLASESPIHTSQYRLNNEANLLRLLTLYKHGGIYLDLDVVTIKSFDSLPKNWVGKESEKSPNQNSTYDWIGSAIIGATKDKIGRNFTEMAIRKFLKEFKPNLWGYNGPRLIIDVLKEICNASKIREMSAKTCHGIEVLSQKYLYPLNYVQYILYFIPYDQDLFLKLVGHSVNLDEAYTHHIWNRLSQTTKVEKGSLFDRIAKEFCPTTYEVYGNLFGN